MYSCQPELKSLTEATTKEGQRPQRAYAILLKEGENGVNEAKEAVNQRFLCILRMPGALCCSTRPV